MILLMRNSEPLYYKAPSFQQKARVKSKLKVAKPAFYLAYSRNTIYIGLKENNVS